MLMCEHVSKGPMCGPCQDAHLELQGEMRRTERHAFSWMCPTHECLLEGTTCPQCPPVVDANRVVELTRAVVEAARVYVDAHREYCAAIDSGEEYGTDLIRCYALETLETAVDALNAARGAK
jgi:hypothetical protein